MRILFENNKTCSYEVEYQPDCAERETERVNREFGGEW